MKNIKKIIMLAGIVATFATSFAEEMNMPMMESTSMPSSDQSITVGPGTDAKADKVVTPQEVTMTPEVKKTETKKAVKKIKKAPVKKEGTAAKKAIEKKIK